MLNVKNILNSMEAKATSKLPIGEKETEALIKKYRSETAKTMLAFWLASGAVITNEVISNSIAMNNLDWGVEAKIKEIADNWRNDLLIPFSSGVIFANGSNTSKIVSNTIGATTKFSITEPAVTNFVNTQTLALKYNLQNLEIGSLRVTLNAGLRNNWTQPVIKDLMKQHISLTTRESEWVSKRFIKNFNSEITRGIEEMGLSPFKATQRARRYALKQDGIFTKRLTNARINRITRTEMSRLKGFSDQESLKQAISTGKIQSATKTWRKTGYNDNWPSSDQNNGSTVPVDSAFPSGDHYENEINGRCIVTYNIKFNKRGI